MHVDVLNFMKFIKIDQESDKRFWKQTTEYKYHHRNTNNKSAFWLFLFRNFKVFDFDLFFDKYWLLQRKTNINNVYIQKISENKLSFKCNTKYNKINFVFTLAIVPSVTISINLMNQEVKWLWSKLYTTSYLL